MGMLFVLQVFKQTETFSWLANNKQVYTAGKWEKDKYRKYNVTRESITYKWNHLYLQRKQVLFPGVCHVAPPCFYSGPQQSNATHTFHILALLIFTAGSTVHAWKRRVSWGVFSWLLTSRIHQSPHTWTLWGHQGWHNSSWVSPNF